MHRLCKIRIPTFVRMSAYVNVTAVCLALSCVSPAIAGPIPANVESVGGLANSGILPGAKPGATVPAAAGGYAIYNGPPPVEGSGTLRFSAAGTTSQLTPLALTFPTPTAGNKTGWGDNTKTKLPNTGEVALSTLYSTGGNPPAGTPVIVGRGEWLAAANSSTLSASASVDRRFAGYAAGYASDPYTVAAGTYTVAPALDGGLLLQTNPADPTSEAAIRFSADSVGLGSANSNLWTLGITEIGTSSPIVSFTSAPILGLDDATIKALLQSALDTSTPGTVLFKSAYQSSGYSLFSTTLSSGSDFQFGDTFDADAANNVSGQVQPPTPIPSPEPGSLVLLGTGVVSLLGYSWRRRKVIAR
jgi:PEP-CTERM motif